MPKRSKLLLSGLVWVAAFLRSPSLFNNHFHADEALFASWARIIAVWRDSLLLTQLVDKPPLIFYLQALFFPLIGPEEWAARLPNYIASLLLIPLVAILAWYLYRDTLIPILAALIITLSPLTIQFSSTAFTDPMLTVWITMSILFIVYRPSPVFAGLVFGLAVATKHQAWLFLPLVLLFAWLQSWTWRHVRRWLIGFSPIIVLLVIWGNVRGEGLLLWSQQINNFGGVRFAWSWETLARFLAWGQQWHEALGGWLGVGLVLLTILFLYFRAIKERDSQAKLDLALIIFVVGYTILHWLLAVPVWDRYILPLIPFVAILIARGSVCFYRWFLGKININTNEDGLRILKQYLPFSVLLFILMLQLPGAFSARDGRWSLGGRPDSDQGAWQVADYLAEEPYGTVLYDHWYSWHWQYHLFDEKVYVSWFQHPQALVEDLEVFGNTMDKRYLVLPASSEALPIIRAISMTEYSLLQIMQTDYEPGMVLYLVEQREGSK